MRVTSRLKKPFGTAKMVDITHVRYLDWEDAFDVEFEDGLSFLEPHGTIIKANKISAGAVPVEVVLDEETRLGFEVRYDNGQVAEVSWAFIRELPPTKSAKRKTSSHRLRSVALLLALFQSLCLTTQAQPPITAGSDGYDGPPNLIAGFGRNMADRPDGNRHDPSLSSMAERRS